MVAHRDSQLVSRVAALPQSCPSSCRSHEIGFLSWPRCSQLHCNPTCRMQKGPPDSCRGSGSGAGWALGAGSLSAAGEAWGTTPADVPAGPALVAAASRLASKAARVAGDGSRAASRASMAGACADPAACCAARACINSSTLQQCQPPSTALQQPEHAPCMLCRYAHLIRLWLPQCQTEALTQLAVAAAYIACWQLCLQRFIEVFMSSDRGHAAASYCMTGSLSACSAAYVCCTACCSIAVSGVLTSAGRTCMIAGPRLPPGICAPWLRSGCAPWPTCSCGQVSTGQPASLSSCDVSCWRGCGSVHCQLEDPLQSSGEPGFAAKLSLHQQAGAGAGACCHSTAVDVDSAPAMHRN